MLIFIHIRGHNALKEQKKDDPISKFGLLQVDKYLAKILYACLTNLTLNVLSTTKTIKISKT
jgi:hypothetical protein